MQLVKIEAAITWAGMRTTMGYVAKCDPLKLTAQAETWQELMATIASILDDFFRARLEDGDLTETLSGLGWSKALKLAPGVDANGVTFDVPFEVDMAA